MTRRDTPWPAGTPCWVDLVTPDLDASRRFYGKVFGWQFPEADSEAGGDLMAVVDGRPVAGIGPVPDGMDLAPEWSTFLATDDATATAAAIAAAGGTVIYPPSDLMGTGTMGIARDPTGARFGIWQAGSHIGARLANEPNSLIWNELMTRDHERAKDFYAAVFGYTYTEIGDPGLDYSMIAVAGNTVGGLGALPPEVPAARSAHWRAYFAVTDADACVAAVTAAGGSVLRPAADMPYGRHADVTDPHGASFSIIKPAPPG